MVKKIALWIMTHRFIVIVVITVLSLFFALQIRKIEVKTIFGDLLPQNHSYIKIHKKYEKQLGDPLKVFLMLKVKEGDIYNPETLEKIQRITNELDSIPGVNHNLIYSIGSRKVKKITVFEDTIITEDLMKEPPDSREGAEKLRETIRNTRGVYGIYVSPDEKSTLFTATFIADRLDYNILFERINKLIESESDRNHIIYAAGEPVLTGWVYKYQNEMCLIFGVTFFTFLGLLFLCFRNLLGVVIHIPPVILGIVWFLGFCGLLGYNLEPLTLVIPLLITARSLSHSVQFTERYFEHFEELKDIKAACVETICSVLPPGTLGIATDALGILLIAVAPIPMMQKLAYLTGFWAFSIIFTGQLFTPVLISFFTPPKNIPEIVDMERGMTQKILGGIARIGFGKPGVAIFIGTILLAALTGWITSKVRVGDINPGTPILWEDSDYNVAISQINKNFPGTEELYILVEGDGPRAVESPDFLNILDTFQRHMEKSPLVAATLSIADFLPPIHRQVYAGYPKLEILPKDKEESSQLFYCLVGHAAPEDFDRYFKDNGQAANVIVWYKDHMGDTIRTAISNVKDFIDQEKDWLTEKKITFQLASGNIGILAAINETVKESQFLNFILVMGIIFLLCSITYRSMVAAVILMVPLNLTNLITLSIMKGLGIGLNINTLPIVSVGVGVGIDYGIYLLSRLCEEYQARGEYSLVVATKSIKTTGKAIFFTATAMIAGVIFWYFLSSLKFQAEMGLLLAIIMFINMVAALLLIPSIIFVFRPKFLGRVRIGRG